MKIQKHSGQYKLQGQCQLQTFSNLQQQQNRQNISNFPLHLTSLAEVNNQLLILQNILTSQATFTKVQLFTDKILSKLVQANHQSITVDIHYGYFKKRINVMFTEIPKQFIQKKQESIIGGFGFVRFCKFRQQIHAIKFISIKGRNKYLVELSPIYQEYFLSCIASKLKIGPCVTSLFGFDIIICPSFAFWSMQTCTETRVNNISSMKQELMENLKLLNSLKIIHNDLKPSNLAYSYCYNRHVFLDFGLSRFIAQEPGFKTKTKFEGTFCYSSLQMKKCSILNASLFVDLYENDYICLKKSLDELESIGRLMLGRQNIESQLISKILNNGKCGQELSLLATALKFKCFLEQNKQIKAEKILGQDIKTLQIKETIYKIFKDFDSIRIVKFEQQSPIKNKIEKIKLFIFSPKYKKSGIDKLILNSIQESSWLKFYFISQLLQIHNDQFKEYLKSPEFAEKIFLAFNPLPEQKLSQNTVIKNSVQLQKQIVDKVYKALNQQSNEKVYQFEKVRFCLLYFSEKMIYLKNVFALDSLRILFVAIQDFPQMFRLQKQTLINIECPIFYLLKIIEFTLAWNLLLQGELFSQSNWVREADRKCHLIVDTKQIKIAHQLKQIYSYIQQNIKFKNAEKMQQLAEVLHEISMWEQHLQYSETCERIKWLFENSFCAQNRDKKCDSFYRYFAIRIYSRYFFRLPTFEDPPNFIFVSFKFQLSKAILQEKRKDGEALQAIRTIFQIYSGCTNHTLLRFPWSSFNFRVKYSQGELRYISYELIVIIDKMEQSQLSLKIILSWIRNLLRQIKEIRKQGQRMTTNNQQLLQDLYNIFIKTKKKDYYYQLIQTLANTNFYFDCFLIEIQFSFLRNQHVQACQFIRNMYHECEMKQCKNLVYTCSLIKIAIFQINKGSKSTIELYELLQRISLSLVKKNNFTVFEIVPCLLQKVILFYTHYQKQFNQPVQLLKSCYKNSIMRFQSEQFTQCFQRGVIAFCNYAPPQIIYNFYIYFSRLNPSLNESLHHYFIFQLFLRIKNLLSRGQIIKRCRKTSLSIAYREVSMQMRVKQQVLSIFRQIDFHKSRRKKWINLRQQGRHNMNKKRLRLKFYCQLWQQLKKADQQKWSKIKAKLEIYSTNPGLYFEKKVTGELLTDGDKPNLSL